MSGWRIETLAAHPQHVDTLAEWHHAEWGALMAPWSLADALAELRSHAQSEPYPVTWVGLDEEGALAGSVSLVETDAPPSSPSTRRGWPASTCGRTVAGAALAKPWCAR